MTRVFSNKAQRVLLGILVLAILLLGAYLRLHNIEGYMTFLGDEGRDVLVVKRMIVDHKFTLLGPTASVGGFFLGPIYYYFMLPFLWAWNLNPVGPAVMVALFGVATILLMYIVGASFFGVVAGVIASSLYAVSPLVIAYSRSSWNPNLVPFFSLLLVYFLWRIPEKNAWKELFWVGIILGIGIQLHYLFLFLFVVTGVWFLFYGRKRKYLWSYLLGVVGFVMGYSPFLAFEVRHGFPNTLSILSFLQSGQGTGFSWMTFVNNINDVVYRVFGRLLLRLPDSAFWEKYHDTDKLRWFNGTWLLISLSFSAIGLSLIGRFRGIAKWKQKLPKRLQDTHVVRGAALLAVWLVVIVFLFGLYKKGIYDYYFGIFFGLPFLCLGFISWVLWEYRLGKAIVLLVWMGLLYFNWQGRPFIYTPNNQLAQARTIAEEAIAKTDGKPYNFALIADHNSDHVFRYFFEIWGKPPVTIEFEGKDPERKTVTDQLIVICDNPNCQPLGHPLWEVAGFGRAQIAGYWDVPFVRIYKLVHYNEQGK